MDKDLRQVFASNLRHELANRDWTQLDFRHAYNRRYQPALSTTAVSQWCTGTAFPRVSALENLSELLDKPASYFLETIHTPAGKDLSKQPISSLAVGNPPHELPLDKDRQAIMNELRAVDNAQLPAIARFVDYANRATDPIDLDRLEAALRLI